MNILWGYRVYTLPMELAIAPPSEVARYMAQHYPTAPTYVLYEEACDVRQRIVGWLIAHSQFDVEQVEPVLDREKFLEGSADVLEEIQAVCREELVRRPWFD